MICFRDITFCTEKTCSKFGDGNDDCFRSLTLAQEHMAYHWWNNGDNTKTDSPPICQFADRPDCYVERKK